MADASLEAAKVGMEATWMSEFWPPRAVQRDLSFQHAEFLDYIHKYGIEFLPVPPRRHHKNKLEPKHAIIGSIYLRLTSATPSEERDVMALQAIRISNDLYGNDVMSSFEIAMGFTKPMDQSISPTVVPMELSEARDTMIAKRKYTKLLQSNITKNPAVATGDMVQVYVKKEMGKRGRWLSPRVVLSYDETSGSVTIPSGY